MRLQHSLLSVVAILCSIQNYEGSEADACNQRWLRIGKLAPRLRHTCSTLAFIVLAVLCFAQTPREGPMPLPPSRKPDFWELDRPAAARQSGQIDIAQARRQADELAKLASTIPADLHDVQVGLLPKDLKSNLKRIEKLSKELRRELGE
jgi:hypothetical protein